jgi:regulator of nucleoside diphosphate kinase
MDFLRSRQTLFVRIGGGTVTERKIHITEFDKRRLEELIAVAEEFGGQDRKDLESLAQELERAEVVLPKDVPPNVVTMNSKVILRDLSTSEKMTYVLVFPREANIKGGAISVLAPVGTAILGYAKGDIIEWPVPSGMRRICIEEILYQPEAAGDFHL